MLNLDYYPSPDGIEKTVSSLREVSRIGDASGLVITAGSCVPWLVALVKWCLGRPPEILMNGNIVLLPQPDFVVTVIFADDKRFETEITINIQRAYDSLPEMIETNISRPDGGENRYHHQFRNQLYAMVDIADHGKQSLAADSYGRYPNNLWQRALIHAVPFALNQVYDLLVYSEERLYMDPNSLDEWTKTYLSSAVTYAFLPKEIVVQVMCKYLSLEEGTSLRQLPEGTLFTAQELVRMLHEWKERPCLKHQAEQEQDHHMCPAEEFMKRLSVITASILSLSLLHSCLHYIQVVYSGSDYASLDSRDMYIFPRSILKILTTGKMD